MCRVDAGPDDLLDLITALVDKSILIREQTNSTVRFRMLETLRIYGHEKLAPTGEYPELARRHASWYAALARRAESEWISPRQLDWIARLDREQPNLRAAMRFCLTDGGNRDEKTTIGLQIAVALLPYGVSRGMLDEGRYWLVRFLARSHGQPIVLRAEGLYAVTAVASLQGDLAAGSAAVAKGRSLTAQAPDPTARGWIAYADGLLALCSGDPSRARESLEAALEAFQAVQERTAQVGTLHLLGLTYGHLGDATKELACYDRVLELTESHGEVVYRAYTLWATAVALWRQGHRDRAVPLLEEGLHLTRQIHDPLTVTISLETLAWIASAEGNAVRAATLMGAADGRGQSMGSASIFYPHLRGYHEECERASRRALGTRAFQTARAKGRALDLDAAVSYALGEQPQPVTSAPDSGALTRRERQIAKLVAQGLTNKAIAARLVISPRTVDGHVEHILTKLGFTSRAQIAAWVGAEEGAERP
ncbi:hypothetical protein C5E51_02710 [Nocardia nova]|uniref:ATP-binding protein n=1 Tax=Nocardia nova TaxID=37330 RepID=UPI000CE9B509|nr:LuxR C-terminal-related transcriptional regulator [Nocardia nova]PPJ14406.1 hypothetical protein C5E51_02710 [Nocardia nova]